MIPAVLAIVIAIMTWGFVKQAALTFDKAKWWDVAEPAAGIVGAVAFAYTHYPFIWSYNDPLLMWVRNFMIVGVGIVIVTLFISIQMESEGIRTPDGLAAPPIRVRQSNALVDEIDELDDWPRHMWDHDEWRATVAERERE